MSHEVFVVERPTGYPAKCVRCGCEKYDGRRYADVAEADSYGAVYLCTLCIREVFKAAFPDEGPPVAEIEDKLANSQLTVELQRDIITNLRAQIETMEKTYGILEPSSDFNESSSNPPVANDKGSESSKGTTSSRTTKKRAASKSATGTGSKDVPSLTELLKAGSDK